MYKCVIIDDEPHAIEGLKKYIDETPNLTLVNFYTDPLVALKEINNSDPVDLILLDVNMPEISGIELAVLINSKTSKIVFTTGHTKHAFAAFGVNADGYLLKPYSLASFNAVINHLFPKVNKRNHNDFMVDEMDDFFFVKSKEENMKLIKIKYKDISTVESKLNYVLIETKDKSILTHMSLTEISEKLTEDKGFIKLHRSYIIAVRYIESIEGNTIIMNNNKKLTIGDFYRKNFNVFIESKLIKSRHKN